mgnify:CR=1 FL=1
MDHHSSAPDAIQTAGTYYQGWLSFTRWCTRSIIAISVLLALMAVTLV